MRGPGFTKTVGLELAQAGNITCNAVCPGYVLTDLVQNQLADTARARNMPVVCAANPHRCEVLCTISATYA